MSFPQLAEQVSHSMQVRCHGCHAQFRLTPRRTAAAITELPCPACSAIIHVPPYQLVRNPVEDASRFEKIRREETTHGRVHERQESAPLPDGEAQGWTRVRLGALFNRPEDVPPVAERSSAPIEPTALQNRFRPVATEENLESDAAPAISNLGVFGQLAQQKEPSARPVVFGERPESVDSFAIPAPASAVELVRNAKRLPETDKPDDVHPLAAVLLKQLREKRSHAPTPRSIAAVAPAVEHKSMESADVVTADVDSDLGLSFAFEHVFDDVFDLDSAFDTPIADDLVTDIVSPVQEEPAKHVALSSEPIAIIEASVEPEFMADASSVTATVTAESLVAVEEPAKRVELTPSQAVSIETPVQPVAVQQRPPPPLPEAPESVVRPLALAEPEVVRAELDVPAESLVQIVAEVAETKTGVGQSRKLSQPHLAIFAGLLVATAVASALVVHVYHSKTAPAVEKAPAPVAFAISEPVDVDLSRLRSLWSAIAVASETVNGATTQTARQRILGLVESGMSERAKQMILGQVRQNGVTPESQALFDMNLRADPRLDYSLITIVPNADPSVIVDGGGERLQKITSIDELRALGGGHSVSFRLTRGGENLYAFKPDQRVWQGGWRTEVAAYNLCFIMVCHFNVPENRAARISRNDFETMYGQINTEKQRKYAARFDELIWESEANADGSVTEYLYGTLKEWIPQFALWPIEYDDIWQSWVDHAADPALLDVPLSDAIAALKSRPNSSFYTGILREQSGATTRSLAQQVSTLLVFDYLTNNHDRFSLIEDYYGVNNHFADGNFVSIDNGAAFQFQAMQKIQTRFEQVTRFSRSTIYSLRLMRPEAVSEMLFPDAISAENLRLEVFWQQRKRLLERVDALIKKHGEAEILFFD